MKNKIAFVSGHVDITEEEFNLHYKDKLDEAIVNGDSFVMGESNGVDDLAQKYLNLKGVKNITIYHLFEKPRVNYGNYQSIGGYTKHSQKDKDMTLNSDYDIAWSKRKGSGTDQNLKRRAKLN